MGRLRAPHAGRVIQLWRRAALVWLQLALLLVPSIGQLHQVLHVASAHVPAHAPAASFQAASRQTTSLETASASGQPAHWLHRLLANHAPADCLLLDQLALGQALRSAAMALPPTVPSVAPAALHSPGLAARHVALFQARGPPTGRIKLLF